MTRRNQQGFTLVELLVAMVVLGVILVGVVQVFSQQAKVSISNEDETDMQADVQGAMYMIRSAIVMAGFGRTALDSFAFTNVSGTAVGGDALSLVSASKDGSSVVTFVLTRQPIVTGNEFTLHCKGVDNTGSAADPARDPILVPGTRTFLIFKSAFDGKLLTGIGANPVEIDSDSGPNCLPHPNPDVDLNNDGAPDPVVVVKTKTSLTTVPRGATVYAYRESSTAPASTTPVSAFALDTARHILSLNGVPILYGIEDFQVQFQTADGTWLNDLAGVTHANIVQVGIGLVVRADRTKDASGTTQFTTFDHTYTVPAADAGFTRKQHFYYVRTRNNAF